jgi:arylsulfatase A-like enzyme
VTHATRDQEPNPDRRPADDRRSPGPQVGSNGNAVEPSLVTPDRPNVVVVCCDNLGFGDLGCYGAGYDTPTVDALADDGVGFTDWHSGAPVCSPSRASLLTGRYPRRAGSQRNVPSVRGGTAGRVLPVGVTTLASALSGAGYRTGAFGKWHLGMEREEGPLAHGFDEFFGFRSGCVDYYSHLYE